MQYLAQISSRNKYPITTVLILDSVYIGYKLVPGLVCIGSRFSLYLLHIQSVLFVCSLCTGSMFSLYWLHVYSVLAPCPVCFESVLSLYCLCVHSVLVPCSVCIGSTYQFVLSPCSVCSVCVFFSF